MGVSENRDTHEYVADMGKLNYDKPDLGVPHFRSNPSPNVNQSHAFYIPIMFVKAPFPLDVRNDESL